jgi:ABC-type sugar transport system ATPase subunit
MLTSPRSTAAPVAIRISDVAKRYAHLQVLDGMYLVVNRGEFFGLVGVNGAG